MSRLRRLSWPIGAGLLLLAVTVGVLVSQQTKGGALDPRSNAPAGSKALAQLLRNHGVVVDLVTSDEDALARADAATTVLVAAPDRLRPKALASLRESGARVVAVAADEASVSRADLPAEVVGQFPVADRAPACADPAAVRAGVVEAGGVGYRTADPSAVGCYAVEGAATYLALDRGRFTLLGSGDLLTNDRLDQQGNAALALSLLGRSSELVWLLPPAPPVATRGQGQSLRSLLPRQVTAAALALAVAVVLLAAARARRLGRVVPEPLPVVVRSAETVEGTARLYRAARARDSAAEALRAAVRDRLRRALSVPTEHRPEALVDATAARSPRDAREIGALLYGLAPPDDDALVALADALDALDLEVRRP